MQKTPFQIPHRFPTVLKCLSASQLRKTMKYEISGNFPWHGLWKLAEFSESFDLLARNLFLNITLNTAELKKIPKDSIPYSLDQQKCIIRKKYQICIDCSGILAVLQIPKHDTPLDFTRYQDNHLTFLNSVFCYLLQILLIKYHPAGVTLTLGCRGKQGSHGAFETECRHTKLWLLGKPRCLVYL